MEQKIKDELVIEMLRSALATMLLIHAGRVEVAESGFVIDLREDIQRLRAALILMGHFEQ